MWRRLARAYRFGAAAVVLGAGAAGATGVLAPPAAAQSPTLVFIVRHAEKAAEPAADPPLTTAGAARAAALADLLANANIGAVISTPYVRTTTTAQPTAGKFGVPVETVAISGGVAAHAQAVAQAVRAHAGKSVLVVGHSNTITAIAAALGAPRLPDLCDSDYDQLLIVELAATGAPRFVRARFGAPSAAEQTGCPAMR